MKVEKRKAVFLDRDGILNRAIVKNGKPYPPSNLDELEIPQDVPRALQALKEAGFLLIGVTNQPDVSRGTQQREVVEAIHAALLRALPLDEILVCYHDDEDGCSCRKPMPGLLYQAAETYSIDLSSSFMIGDRWKDVEAGQRAGCVTILIDHHYIEKGSDRHPDCRVSLLSEAASCILTHQRRGKNSLKSISELEIKIFADGADKEGMLEMYRNPLIKGFTTNPTLLRKAGVSDYEAFALDILKSIPDRPISFEVLSDEFEEMEVQAQKISRWGKNVYVKIPVTNTRAESSINLIRKLVRAGIKLNVTAMMTLDQIRDVSLALEGGISAYLSVFVGRIADTGRDPLPLMSAAVELVRMYSNIELIWASPREILNIFQADLIGCQIITVTYDILKKLDLIGKDLHKFSLDTVKMFHDDALKAGYVL